MPSRDGAGEDPRDGPGDLADPGPRHGAPGDDGSGQEFVSVPGLFDGVVSATGYGSHSEGPWLHRGLPSPYLTLIFSLDEPLVVGESEAHARGPGAHRTDVVLGGLHRGPAYVAQPPVQRGVQLALHPLAARTLLGVPAGELTRMVDHAPDVLGREAAEVRERMCAQEDWAGRFAVLRAYLRRRAGGTERRAQVRPEVAEAWRWMARHRGAGPLEGMARHVALGERQLGALFRREVGLSPKQAGRLMRFDHAVRTIGAAVASGRPPDLAGVAARGGYFDQSHMVRDFRQFAGLSPTGWIAAELRNVQAAGRDREEGWKA
jgi:AraC-like DNA-binding protein